MGGGRSERGPRRPPAERVRARLAAAAPPGLSASMPAGYQRLGRVLLLRLPGVFRPYFPLLGEAWRAELGVTTVLAQVGPVSGELRRPAVERIAGGPTETEVVEHGIRWRLDAAELMFAAGNRTERERAGRLVTPGETVVDLFAGIGYFAIPAAVRGRAGRVVAVEKNPVAFRYLLENAARNGVADRIDGRLGENRTIRLEPAAADRVFLGYLPDAVPWVGRALGLVRPAGGWLHVHAVEDAHGASGRATARVGEAIRDAAGELLEPLRAREVKPYGPGRTHVVVDARVRPG